MIKNNIKIKTTNQDFHGFGFVLLITIVFEIELFYYYFTSRVLTTDLDPFACTSAGFRRTLLYRTSI